MSQSPFSIDDLPPEQLTVCDIALLHQLEESVSQRFYIACDRITRALLKDCDWFIATNEEALTLVIGCVDVEMYWHVVSDLEQLGNRLSRFANLAKIRVCPPVGKGRAIEVAIDDIASYRDQI